MLYDYDRLTCVIEENGELINVYRTLEEKMHRIVLFWFLSIVTASMSYWMPTNAEEKERQQDVSRLFEDLSEGEKQFVALKQDASRDLNDEVQPYLRRQDLATEKKGLQLLMEILSQIESESAQKKKRSCQFNLGGHCSTESAAFLADRWHYLDSAMSPGRKRSPQAIGITRKLIRGKLFADSD